MDGQGTARSLVCAIPSDAVFSWLVTRLMRLGRELLAAANESLKSGMSLADTHQFEVRVEKLMREFLRLYVEFCFNLLEPSQVEAMPQNISYRNQSYRRLKQKSTRASILTRFGNITLNRAIYRQGSRGRTISPLEKILGIECGATPGARDLIGRQIAEAGASQERCIEAIAERTGARIGFEKLRNITAHLADIMEPQRQACQVQQLEQWIDEAVKKRKNVTLAISRDGVSLGIAPFGNFEMASVASLSVIADGKRIGTVYLARAPEENQETLSQNLTALLREIIRSRRSQLQRLVYVTDAGKIETAYWKNVLRHLHVDGKRVKIERIVDYYHVSLRLTTIADALWLTSSRRKKWLKRVRKLLLEPGGWGRVKRSIAAMIQNHSVRPTCQKELEQALRYLHRYRRFMNYSEHRSQGSPIGSGVVESACKQIVTERLKLSGMRWTHAGAQHILTLRSILLSQTWTTTFHNAIQASATVNALCNQQAHEISSSHAH